MLLERISFFNMLWMNMQNIDNKSEGFLKDHVTLKTGVMADENTTLHYRNKLYFKV